MRSDLSLPLGHPHSAPTPGLLASRPSQGLGARQAPLRATHSCPRRRTNGSLTPWYLLGTWYLLTFAVSSVMPHLICNPSQRYPLCFTATCSRMSRPASQGPRTLLQSPPRQGGGLVLSDLGLRKQDSALDWVLPRGGSNPRIPTRRGEAERGLGLQRLKQEPPSPAGRGVGSPLSLKLTVGGGRGRCWRGPGPGPGIGAALFSPAWRARRLRSLGTAHLLPQNMGSSEPLCPSVPRCVSSCQGWPGMGRAVKCHPGRAHGASGGS